TAREGGQALRQTATNHLRGLIGEAKATGSARLLSARHEFPTAWAAFNAAIPNPTTRRAPLTLHLRREHYPFFATPSALTQVEVIARRQRKDGVVEVADHAENGAGTRVLKLNTEIGDLRRGRLVDAAAENPEERLWAGSTPQPYDRMDGDYLPLTLYLD